MAEFVINLRYLDPKFYRSDPEGFMSECKSDADQLSAGEIRNVLNTVADQLEGSQNPSPELLGTHEIFDPIYKLSCNYPQLDGKHKSQIQKMLCSGVPALVSQVKHIDPTASAQSKREMRNCVKMYAYLLCMLVNSAEKEECAKPDPKAKKKGILQWDWPAVKEVVIGALTSILDCVGVKQLWNMGTPEEDFGNMFFKTGCTMFENQKNLKVESIRKELFRLICLVVSQYNLMVGFPAHFVHILMHQESSPPHVAELCKILVLDFNCPTVVGNIIREIGRRNSPELLRELKGSRNLGFFLEEIAQRVPTQLNKDIAVIIPHLDSESYLMRNGVIRMLGALVLRAFNDVAPEVALKEKEKILDLIEERCMDVTSYTRCKALRTLADLIGEDAIPVNRIASVMRLAVDRLQDRSSTVRKGALQLLTMVVQRNPFGGKLDREVFGPKLEEFKTKIIAIEQERQKRDLEAARRVVSGSGIQLNFGDEKEKEDVANGKAEATEEEKVDEKSAENGGVPMDIYEIGDEQAGNGAEKASEKKEAESADVTSAELEELRRQLIFNAAAMRFIRDLGECVPALCRLLSSKLQSDVLETIKFFIVAWQFQLKNWQLGFQKMLPLVWNKDPLAVRDAVLDSFRFIYIGNADLEGPQGQIEARRIALVLTEFADAATLKETTCIEELIALMMEKSMIPGPVVRALWAQFLSSGSTQTQRRNALVVLTHAASFKPKLLSCHFAEIIRLGFRSDGGEVDARFQRTALVAISKYAASAKAKISPEIRDAIVRHISEIMDGKLVPGTEWFSAAQTAVNTLFVVGDDATQLCEKAIRRFAMRVLGKLSKEAAADKPSSYESSKPQIYETSEQSISGPSQQSISLKSVQSTYKQLKSVIPDQSAPSSCKTLISESSKLSTSEEAKVQKAVPSKQSAAKKSASKPLISDSSKPSISEPSKPSISESSKQSISGVWSEEQDENSAVKAGKEEECPSKDDSAMKTDKSKRKKKKDKKKKKKKKRKKSDGEKKKKKKSGGEKK
eukprot:499384_1